MMELSVVIPVYNEEKTIKQVLESLLTLTLPCQKEIILVDDGSTDATPSQIKNLIRLFGGKNFKIIRHKTNQGKGAAIRSGIKAASGDYILIQDADLEYNPVEITALLEPILQRRQKIAVYGSRFIKKKVTMPFIYLLGNKILTFLTNFLYGTRLTDMETGYKLLPASFIKNIRLESRRFDIEPEITVKLIKSRIPIIEVPISYKGRTHLAGKKLTLKDAIDALKTLLYFKFRAFLPLVLILVLGSFLRFYRMRELSTFLADQAIELSGTAQILAGNFTLIGIKTSVAEVRNGAVMYYFLAPFLYLFNFDPIAGGVLQSLLSLGTVVLVYVLGSPLAGFFIAASPLSSFSDFYSE